MSKFSSDLVEENIPTFRGEEKKSSEEKRLRMNEYMRNYGQRLRFKVLMHYSGNSPFCKCCGEKNIGFLSIDHINNDGGKHRREIKTSIYFWLIKNNFPEGFQVMCFNCNMGRQFNNYICPHTIPRKPVFFDNTSVNKKISKALTGREWSLQRKEKFREYINRERKLFIETNGRLGFRIGRPRKAK